LDIENKTERGGGGREIEKRKRKRRKGRERRKGGEVPANSSPLNGPSAVRCACMCM
jgi:hypothetical protein